MHAPVSDAAVVWSQINAGYHSSCAHTFQYHIWTTEHNANYCQAAGLFPVITPLLHSSPFKLFPLLLPDSPSPLPCHFLTFHFLFFSFWVILAVFFSLICHSSPLSSSSCHSSPFLSNLNSSPTSSSASSPLFIIHLIFSSLLSYLACNSSHLLLFVILLLSSHLSSSSLPSFICHSSPLLSSSQYSHPLFANHSASSSCHSVSPLTPPFTPSHFLSSSDSTSTQSVHHISFLHCSHLNTHLLFYSSSLLLNLLRHLSSL